MDNLKEDVSLENLPKKVNREELVAEVKDFFEMNRKEIGEVAKVGGKIVKVDFQEFSAHSPETSEKLIEETRRNNKPLRRST